MLPMKAVRIQLGDLLAADATTLAPAVDANKIFLIKSDFVLGENLTIDNVTAATFTGSTPKAGATGSQQTGIDPATQNQVITILAPAGGYRWECTAAPAEPETIFGYGLANSDLDTLLGLQKLIPPVNIVNVGDYIDVGAVEMDFVAQPLS